MPHELTKPQFEILSELLAPAGGEPSPLDSVALQELERLGYFRTPLGSITLNTPKPLVRVHGRRIIDSLLDACLAAGIKEIYLVRGYLAEQFDQLLYQYPMIRFLENTG